MSKSPVVPIVYLRSCEGGVLTINRVATSLSKTLTDIIELYDADNNDNQLFKHDPLPLERVSTFTLRKIIIWCEECHSMNTVDATKWAREAFFERFIDRLNSNELFHVFMGANFMGVDSLVTRCAKRVAELADGLTVESARRRFNISNDYTPLQEAHMKYENPWDIDLK